MFLVKRDYFNKTYIIKGLIIALIFSAFIYLSYFDISNKFINSILGLVSLYFILQAKRQEAFFIGFFIGLLWFYWIGITFQYYGVSYLAPLIILFFGISYGVIFFLLCFFKSIILRIILLLCLSYFHPFGFNWFIPELVFIDSYFSTSKEIFALILASLYMIIKLPRFKIVALIPLYFAITNTGIYIDNPRLKIDMPQLNVKQDQKWVKDNLTNIIEKNFSYIDNAIKNKKELIVLPETVFPAYLNRNEFLMEKLLEKSLKIDILAGALYYDNEQFFNATYLFSNGSYRVAKKVVLVPFGEKIPLPKFFVDLINETFYDGASDYVEAKKPTDFEIKGIKFRNAICYEATSDEIFQDLGNVRYMIASSNNAWFTPSIEPILQKYLLQYYANKYDITIFHSVNGSPNYIIRP